MRRSLIVGWMFLVYAGGAAACAQTPAANPGRPTVTNPATLPPVGYLQFEQGYLGSLNSPATASQYGVNQVTKIAVQSHVMAEVESQPFARSREVGSVRDENGAGDVLLGAQVVVFTPSTRPRTADGASGEANDRSAETPQKTAVPTVALAYLGRVHSGTTPDVDQGGTSQSALLLLSGDVGQLHYDSNVIVNEQSGAAADGGTMVDGGTARRPQFAQTLSVNHPLGSDKVQIALELYHFTQPLVHATADGRYVARANLVDGLMALSYTLRPNLVLDGGFSRGFTSTSTRWQSFAGFTYLLPKRLWHARG